MRRFLKDFESCLCFIIDQLTELVLCSLPMLNFRKGFRSGGITSSRLTRNTHASNICSDVNLNAPKHPSP